MSRRYLWGILIIVIAMGAYWRLSRPAKTTAADDSETSTPAFAPTTAVPENPVAPQAKADNVKQDLTPQSQIITENFERAIKELQTCHGYRNEIPAGEGDPTVENWKSSVQLELGEPVLRADDWTNTEIQLPGGEKRRIRIENEMTEDNRVVRRLKYAGVDKENLPVPIPLPPDQTEDPNESYVSSLEKDGEITMFEKAERMYFQDGSEFYAVQRNNVVSELEMNKAGKSFHCWNLDHEDGKCECL